jgi:uncharacterized membrane protein
MGKARARTRRALREFMLLPAAVVLGYAALAVISILVDQSPPRWLAPLLRPLSGFIHAQTATTLLAAIATSVVTVTSITFSVLLLAVQQTATSMTPVVFDQFLRRKTNQLYLGMFVGLSLYAFLDLASIDPKVTPAFGATLGLVLSVVAFCALVLLIYSTVDQMRPSSVTQVIHDHALRSRNRELRLIERTRRTSRHDGPVRVTVHAEQDGFVTDVDLDRIVDALPESRRVEVQLLVTLGTRVAFGDPLATVKDDDEARSDEVAEAVRRCIALDRARDLGVDPSLAVDELANIAWTAISSAKHNPQMGWDAIDRLRDLLARWAGERRSSEPNAGPVADGEVHAVVYEDNDIDRLVDALISLIVVCAESRQQESCAHVLDAIAGSLAHLDQQTLDGAERALANTLPAVEAQVLSRPLERSLERLSDTLDGLGRHDCAEQVRALRYRLSARKAAAVPSP